MTASERREIAEKQLKGRKQLELRSKKVPVNDSEFNLVIGLGGTGIQALLETKGLIGSTCAEPETRVACLAFDTSKYEMETARSSEETGEVRLDPTECVLLDPVGMADMFGGACITPEHTAHPELFDWVDTSLTPVSAAVGASGIRQMGRLIFARNNVEKVRDAIESAVTKLTQGATVAKPHLNVFLVSGISGGTGGGIFIDLAYTVRDELMHMPGFVATHHTLYGYFFMPDVNAVRGGNRTILEANAYAALQELDYNMRLDELHEKFELVWKGDPSYHQMTVGGYGRPLFDFVHLVSATNSNGVMADNPYTTSMQAVAQHIVSFVANETAAAGANGQPVFTMSSHYSDIQFIHSIFATQMKDLPGRYRKYLAIGSYNYDLPIDDMMMYEAFLLFRKMQPMFDITPTVGKVWEFRDMIGAGKSSVMQSFVSAYPTLMPPAWPAERASNTARLPDILEWIDVVWKDCRQPDQDEAFIEKAAENAQAIAEKFDAEIKNVFEDPERGPIYANQLIVMVDGLLDQLRDDTTLLMRLSNTDFERVTDVARQAYLAAKAAYDACGLFTSFIKKQECWDVLLKARDALTVAVQRRITAKYIALVYGKLSEHISKQNNLIYDVASQTMIDLKDIFEYNAAVQMGTTETDDGASRNFTWQRITVPHIRDYLDQCFDRVFAESQQDPVQDFVARLWKKATTDWFNDDLYDPKALVSEFMDCWFTPLANMSAEDVVTRMLAPGQPIEPLCDLLYDQLVDRSAPLLYRNRAVPTAGTATFISVPDNCPHILNAFRNRAAHVSGNVIVQESHIRNRVYAQTVECGVSLAAYMKIHDAEKAYAGMCGKTHGLHLIDPKGPFAPENAVSWTELPTLIPRYIRGDGKPDTDIQSLVDREDADKKKVLDRFYFDPEQASYTPRCVMVGLNTTNAGAKWQLLFHTTDVTPVVTGGKLEIVRKGETLMTVDPAMSGAEKLLQGWLANGLGTVAGANETTRVFETDYVNEGVGKEVHSAQRTMENLLEQYIAAVCCKHDVALEIKKHDVLREYLEEVRKAAQRARALFDYICMELLGKIYTRPVDTDNTFFVSINGRTTAFASVSMTDSEPFELDYLCYRYYSNCCDGKMLGEDDRIGVREELLIRRQTRFLKIRTATGEQMREAFLRNDPVCAEWLEKAKAMQRDIEQTLDSKAIQDVETGMGYGVSRDVIDFYKAKLKIVRQLIPGLEVAATTTPGQAQEEDPWW